MLLLFFLLIAMGGLMVIWIMFPGAGVKMPDPLPPRPQTVIVAPQPAEVTPREPDAATAPAASGANASSPELPTTTVSGIADVPTLTPSAGTASPPGTPIGNAGPQPAPIDLDELRKTLEQLVGNPPPATRP